MPEPEPGDEWDSHTWTFYRFVTMLGTVTVRWLGESNGYYSESVDFVMRPACGHTDCATSKDLARACGGR